MSSFEYVTVAYSIVLGVGLGALLVNIAWLIRERDRVRFSALHAGWVLITFQWLAAIWWDLFSVRALETWTWGTFIVALAAVVALVTQAQLVTPSAGDVAADEPVDLAVFCIEHRRPFLFAAMLFWGLAMIHNFQVMHLAPELTVPVIVGAAAIQIGLLGLAAWRREPWAQWVAIGAFLVIHVINRFLTSIGTL